MVASICAGRVRTSVGSGGEEITFTRQSLGDISGPNSAIGTFGQPSEWADSMLGFARPTHSGRGFVVDPVPVSVNQETTDSKLAGTVRRGAFVAQATVGFATPGNSRIADQYAQPPSATPSILQPPSSDLFLGRSLSPLQQPSSSDDLLGRRSPPVSPPASSALLQRAISPRPTSPDELLGSFVPSPPSSMLRPDR
jgi:hypothetical protein